jgi:Tol biopolymer transport system component
MRYNLIFLILLLFYNSINAQYESLKLMDVYFGQEAPKGKAEIFMDRIISTFDEPEMCAAFLENGKEFYYNTLHNGNWTIFVTKIINGKWTIPEPINFTNGYTDRDFTFSPDGKKLFFGSNRPETSGKDKLTRLDIYVSVKTKGGIWSEPLNIGNIINTEYTENYPVVDSSGNLYFFSNRAEGLGGCEIYTSQFINGKYQKPELLGKSINSIQNDWDAFIAPDGSYLIFSSQNRNDSIGMQDLYISYKDSDGNWADAINMGTRVNSSKDEICPSVSSDGKYLFFTSRRRGNADIYWIDAHIIEEIRLLNSHKWR